MTDMSMPAARPYLVIPRLIEQPTWGGTYILELKKWADFPHLKGKKIGQSYELFGKSKLLTHITDTSDPRFLPEFGDASGELHGDQIHDYRTDEYINIQTLFKKTMMILIKINQAMGNSFQVHVHPGTVDKRWLPKPESWYYFEDGLITCGIKKGVDLRAYEKTCKEIEAIMKRLSGEVRDGIKTLETARAEAKAEIARLDPWQYVNKVEVKKNDVVDMSSGAVHHNWEEDAQRFPLGNVCYEIQYDVMDPYCTIRSFDNGKIKDDGTIREIHIDDYFKYLDRSESANNPANLKRVRDGEHLLKTPYYSLDVMELAGERTEKTGDSFHHLFVKEGAVNIAAGGVTVHVTAGHSAFIPPHTDSYTIMPETPSVILKTYV